jgi:Flp pilus assembly protein TadD
LLRYEYGMLAERLGKMAVFEKSMREVIAKDPKYAQAYNALGFTFADKNIRLKEARVLLEKALTLAPNDPFILDSMGWLYYREKNYGVALDYLNRAAALRADPEIVLHQVVVLKAMGRLEEARRVWRSGLQQFPDNEPLRTGGQALGLDDPAIAPTRSL